MVRIQITTNENLISTTEMSFSCKDVTAIFHSRYDNNTHASELNTIPSYMSAMCRCYFVCETYHFCIIQASKGNKKRFEKKRTLFEKRKSGMAKEIGTKVNGGCDLIVGYINHNHL